MPARIDVELVRRGLARSRRQAGELIDAGTVVLDGTTVRKASTPVSDGQLVELTATAPEGYVSRAGFKLAGALDALGAGGRPGVVVAGARCLDLGASTGGFTDVLLRRGAEHVTAVDVGHDQIVESLALDPRVSVREGTNVREMVPADVTDDPSVVVADLSFISLTVILPTVVTLVAPGTALLVMVKPQFEVGRERLGSGGVVRDPALHVSAVEGVVAAAAPLALRTEAVVPSPLPGPSGNREYFLLLRRTDAAVGVPAGVADAVRAAVAWVPDGDVAPGHAPPTPPAFVVPSEEAAR